MKSKKDGAKRQLTLQETIELFGAEEAPDIDPIRLDPLGMKFLATKVGERLKGVRGRPTDKTWTIVRKIPMKQESWDALNQISERLKEQSLHIAAGQVGAYALEWGVEIMCERAVSTANDLTLNFSFPVAVCSEEIREEAKRLTPIIAKEAIW